MVFVLWYGTTMGDMLMSTLRLYVCHDGQVSCWELLSILRVCPNSNAAAKPATLAGTQLYATACTRLCVIALDRASW